MTDKDSLEALPLFSLPTGQSNSAGDFLEGIRILDLTTSLAGPYATMLLGDLGADVIKVERPGAGDDSRGWGPPFIDDLALWFIACNRNKRSVTLDYSQPRGYEILLDLARSSDAVVVNQRPSLQQRLGTDAASLREVKSDLIHVSLTGFGLSGPHAERASYDLIAEGFGGVMDMTGEIDGAPQKVGTPAADLLAGQDAAMAFLAALIRRQRTGVGCAIDVSMYESMARFMTPNLSTYLGSGHCPRRSGGKASVIAIYQVFETLDEPMTLALPNDRIWARFCEATDMQWLLDDNTLQDNRSRQENRQKLVKTIQDLLRKMPRSYWLDLFGEHDVPAGPIQKIDEVANDESLHDKGFLYTIAGDGTPQPQVGLGIRFDNRALGYTRAAPGLGEHNAEVLRDVVNLTNGEIEALADHRVI